MSAPFKQVADNLGGLLADLERRVQTTLDLTAQVRTALQGAEKDRVVSVSCRDETLAVSADSAAWCPRIRYAQQQVLDALRASGETRFTKLKVKVGRRGN